MKYVVFICYTIKILIANWPRTRKFSQLLPTGREDSCFWLFSPCSRVSHALRPIFILWLVKIWQVSSCGKFMQHLEIILFTLTAEADRVLCQLVMFLTALFHWMYNMKFSCYRKSSVIHGYFVDWVFGWEIRHLSGHLSKLEIRCVVDRKSVV